MKPFIEFYLELYANIDPERAYRMYTQWKEGARQAEYYGRKAGKGAENKGFRGLWYGGYLRARFVHILGGLSDYMYVNGKAIALNKHAEILIRLRRDEGANL